MRVIAKATLIDFWRRHPAAESALRAWHHEASRAQWKTPQDIQRAYASASFVAGNRVVFNIKGNEFRLVVAVAYRYEAVYIKFMGRMASTTRWTSRGWTLAESSPRARS